MMSQESFNKKGHSPNLFQTLGKFPGFAGELVVWTEWIYSEGFFAFWIVRRGVEVFQTKKERHDRQPILS